MNASTNSMRVLHKSFRYLKEPGVWKDMARYVGNDVGAALGVYRYPVHLVFIAGLPKSGSTWLNNMLADLPGFNVRRFPALKTENSEDFNDINEDILKFFPKNRYSVLKLHTRYDEASYELIRRYVPKMVVLFRDLRDVCVSLVHHYRVDQRHPHHAEFVKLDMDAALTRSIELMQHDSLPWVLSWKKAVAAHPDEILAVDYEELYAAPRATVARVLGFYGIKAKAAYLENIVATKLSKEENLKENLFSNARLFRINTARKGGSGGWREVFKDEHKKQFKALAGQLLIDAGYEQDMNW